mgnify:CR=1 FL=1
MKKEPLKVEITEMWLAEVGDKCFYGIIKRGRDSNGNPHLFSRININDGIVQGCASDQKVLGKNIDEMCAMYLNGLHKDAGVFTWIHMFDCEQDRETEMHIKEKLFLN